MKYLTCIPAYGRDYTSAKAVKADFAAGKDFQIVDVFSPENGRYVNKSDIAGQAITLNIRYNELTQVCLCKG